MLFPPLPLKFPVLTSSFNVTSSNVTCDPLLHPHCPSPDHFYTIYRKTNQISISTAPFPPDLEECICPGWDRPVAEPSEGHTRGPWPRQRRGESGCHGAAGGLAWGARALRGLLETRASALHWLPSKDPQGWAANQNGSKSCLENTYKYPYLRAQAVRVHSDMPVCLHAVTHTHVCASESACQARHLPQAGQVQR